jgi:ABC-type enterobactin transport system permease subunit
MKCCASPITFIAVNAPSPARAAESTLQAVLFSAILKPLAKGLGPVGDVAVDSVVQHLFVPART